MLNVYMDVGYDRLVSIFGRRPGSMEEIVFLDVLIKDSETDEIRFKWLVRVFIFLSAFFFVWMLIGIALRTFQPYFQGFSTVASSLFSGIPYKSLSAAHRDKNYYVWMRQQFEDAQSATDPTVLETLKAEFREVRAKNFGKGIV